MIDLERDSGPVERVLLHDVQFDAMGLLLVHADFLRMNKQLGLPSTARTCTGMLMLASTPSEGLRIGKVTLHGKQYF